MFYSVINIFVLIGLIKLLKIERDPLMVAGIYTVIQLVFNMIGVFAGEISVIDLSIFTAISFVLAFVYFWLLNKLDSGPIWWVVAVVGIVIGLV